MAKYPVGIIKYGSTDEAVLMQCSLLSEAAVTAAGGTVVGTGTIFDSELGVTATEGVSSGVQFDEITGYADLDNAGQISIDVQSDFLSLSDPEQVGEVGFVKDGSVNYLLTWNDQSGSPFGYIRQALDVLVLKMHQADTSLGASVAISDKDTYTTFMFSWIGSEVTVFYDDKPISSYTTVSTRGTLTADIMKRISVLCYQTQLGSVESQTYVRNLIVSNRPVMFAKHPNATNIGFFGHSFIISYGESPNDNQTGDCGLISMVEKEFSKKGLSIGYTIAGVGGGTTIDTGANPLGVLVAAFMANNPQFIVFCTGANDCLATGTFVAATYETDLKDMITTMMSGTGVLRMILPNVPTIKEVPAYDTAAHVATVAAANLIHNAIPAWWDATKGASDGDVVVSDYFGMSGGETPLPFMFRGQFVASGSNLHPSAKANWIWGTDVANFIINKLN